MAKLGKKRLKRLKAQSKEIMRDVHIIERNQEVIAGSVKVSDVHDHRALSISFEIRVLQNLSKNEPNERGVFGIEVVHVYFPLNYPNDIPHFYLRENFPKNFPHINPFLGPNGLVSPCFFNGDNANLLTQPDGFMGMLDRIHEWLHDAALGNLINSVDGWEPQRRDELDGFLVSDIDKLSHLVGNSKNAALIESRIIFDNDFSNEKNFHEASISMLLLDYTTVPNDYDYSSLSKTWSRKSFEAYESLTIVAWPDEDQVSDEYAPNFINSLKDLLDFAIKIGCKDEVENKITHLESKFQERAKTEQLLVVGIILAVRRPYKLLGKSSSIEFLPYLIYGVFENSPVGHQVFSPLSPVKALGQRHSLNREILAQLNGTDPTIVDTQFHVFGCGSLGSKLVSHLVKGGIGTYALYDKSSFSPHNSARHILDDIGVFSGKNKATLLASYVNRHRATATAYPINVSGLVSKEYAPLNNGVVIDTTASPHVSDAISSADWLTHPIVQAGLYGNGSLGFLAWENADRSVRVTDIQAMLSDLRIDDKNIAAHLPEATGNDLVEIGYGCSSRTMVVSDDVMSEFSAGMSQIIKSILKTSAQENAQLWLGFTSNETPGLNWRQYEIEPFISIQADGWNIRISKPARDKINQISLQHGDKEYGGVLLGGISTLRRRLTITRVIDAPNDSTSSETQFVLGTKGLTESIIDLKKRSGNELTYIGTWHSHPMGGGPSPTDRSSAQNISELRLGAPSALLIWTPQGYRAAVEPKG